MTSSVDDGGEWGARKRKRVSKIHLSRQNEIFDLSCRGCVARDFRDVDVVCARTCTFIRVYMVAGRVKLLHNCYSHQAWKIKAEYRENKADTRQPKWPITRRSLVARLSLVIFVSEQTSFLPSSPPVIPREHARVLNPKSVRFFSPRENKRKNWLPRENSLLRSGTERAENINNNQRVQLGIPRLR